jgi:hypothetical protein
MSNESGEAQSGARDEGMGKGNEAYSQLGAIQQEADRYHSLADAARQAGDYELATRLDQYAADFDTHQDYVKWQVDRARTAVLEIARGERTRVVVTGVLRGRPISEATLAGIRAALLRPDDLARATTERLEDPDVGTGRWVVPMQGGLKYSEVWEDESEVVDVVVEGPGAASPQPSD